MRKNLFKNRFLFRIVFFGLIIFILLFILALFGYYLPKVKIHRPLNVIVKGISPLQQMDVKLYGITPLGRKYLFDGGALKGDNSLTILCSDVLLDLNDIPLDSISGILVMAGAHKVSIQKNEIAKWHSKRNGVIYSLSNCIQDEGSTLLKLRSLIVNFLQLIHFNSSVISFLHLLIILILVAVIFILLFKGLNKLNLPLTINFLLIIAAAFVFNNFLNYKNYTLEENGNWKSTKFDLGGLGLTHASMFTKVALSGNCLNMSTWRSSQELIHPKQVLIDSISFKVKYFDNPFSFILHKSDSFTYGLYFNYNTNNKCCLFIADRSGKFLYKNEFYLAHNMNEKDWNTVELKYLADFIWLKINHHLYTFGSFKLPSRVNVGFRGAGEREVYLDDFVMLDAHNNVLFKDDFSPQFRWNNWPLLLLFSFAAAVYLLRKSTILPSLVLFNLSVLFGIVLLYIVYFFYLSGRYPTLSQIKWHGKMAGFDNDQTVCEMVKVRYPFSQKRPYILFVGSSQTWGAGASVRENAYPSVVEKNLRSYFHDSTITAINTGICGSNSKELYKYYVEQWCLHQPLITVIDLSCNDRDTTIFRKYIRKFLEFNQSKHIKTLLVAEPTWAPDELRAKHLIMKSEGAKFNVETVDMQSYMSSNYETGFLWWDWVHPTDYGYHVLAEGITPYIIKELKRDSLFAKF